MILFPDKDPGDVLDYSFSFADEEGEAVAIRSAEVVVESASPPETPISLIISDVSVVVSDPLAGVADTVVFWQSGGTVGTTYVLRAQEQDNQTAPRDRQVVRRAAIRVAKR